MGRTARQILAARLRGRPTLVSANVYVTQRCNLRCVYCSSPLRNTAELDAEQWDTIFAEIAALGCRRLTFLGGEPLLRKDLGDLVSRARAHGMSVVVTSNGLLVPRRLDALREVDTLVLSLDAPGEANDLMRGQGVFAAVEEAVAAARGVGLAVKLNAVLSAVTAPCLDDLIAFCEERDLAITINIMRSGAPDLWRDAADFKDEDEAIARLCRRLADLSRTNPRLLFSPQTYRYAARWGDFSEDRVEQDGFVDGGARSRGAPRCHAGRAYLSIDADGSVSPCTLTMDRLHGGNAAVDGVRAAWEALHDHSCRACYSPCMVEQNYLHSLKPQVLSHFARRHLTRFA